MAKSKNILLVGVNGTLNKQIVVRQVNGQTIMSAYPDMEDVEWSAAQLANQDVMKEANIESKRIRADVQLRNEALIRLNVTRSQLHNALVSEYFAKVKAVAGGLRSG